MYKKGPPHGGLEYYRKFVNLQDLQFINDFLQFIGVCFDEDTYQNRINRFYIAINAIIDIFHSVGNSVA